MQITLILKKDIISSIVLDNIIFLFKSKCIKYKICMYYR